MIRGLAFVISVLLVQALAAQHATVRGRLMEGANAVPFASVALEPGGYAATSAADGRFQLTGLPAGACTLRVRAVGLVELERRFQLTADENVDLGDLHLQVLDGELAQVVVTGTLREVSRSESPVPVEVIGSAYFRRNPTPALLDAVGMVNGVRPQINCSVCNTGDIHINGMEGAYTMVLIDGMPIVSGLSTVYGLSGIPTGLVERIEVVKGPGSALYGSEAMGGIINVITKDPVTAPRLSIDVQGTTWDERNADLGLVLRKDRVSDLIGVNAYRYADPRDGNGDGFTDLALQERISLFNKLDLQRPERRLASLATRLVAEDRWGGQLGWTEADRGTERRYGENILTRRWEMIGQYQLPVKDPVIVQGSYNTHAQRSWYGLTRYDATQRVGFLQARWGRRIGRSHELLAGAAYRYTWFDDSTPATGDGPVITQLPGVFVQDEWSLAPEHVLLLGHRLDLDDHHGAVHSPRLAYEWAPSGRWTLRAGFGTGFRNVNIFTEDHAALTGARRVVIAEDLRPERSVNGTLNLVRKWPGQRRYFATDLTFFLTRFSNRILPDHLTDPDLIIYRNLQGHGVSRGAALNIEARFGRKVRLLAGVTCMDAWTQQPDASGTVGRTAQRFAPDWSGTFTTELRPFGVWVVDISGQAYGPMWLPVLPNDPRPERSPPYLLLNVQLRRPLGERFEAYAGVKNLLDFVPRDPLMRPFDSFDRQVDDPVNNPYGHTFDTAYMYAPMQGIRGYAGLRFSLDR